MALVSLGLIRALHRIEADDAQITRAYLVRHGLLDQVRSSACLSGMLVLEYLRESNPEVARMTVVRLRRLNDEMSSAARDYSSFVRPVEKQLISDLRKEVDEYGKELEPAFQGDLRGRKGYDHRHLETQVFPRRDRTIAIADKINAINELLFTSDGERGAALFVQLNQRIHLMFGLALCAGAILAAACIAHVLWAGRDARLRDDKMGRAQEEMNKLSARLAEAQEQERRAISRELHDQVGQALSILRVNLYNAAAVTASENQEAHRFLRTAGGLADDSIKSIRNIALLLRPSMLDDLGLVPALGWQAREISRRTGIQIDVVAKDVPEELPEEHKTCVYRIVHEALRNASRHSGARKVRITVQQEREDMVLTIGDDGNGFDAQVVRGLGLLGMEERAKHLGGTFHIQSDIGAGTLLTISLPLVGSCWPSRCVSV
jgi:signal transduction histidine kinase